MTQRKIPKISIGLPVFNGERFIEKKIKSILSQTFKDFELIISDNSSTDMTSTICESYAKIDNRIKFFHQTKNIGAAANFNFVLEKSEGAYFMWTAVDDIIMPMFIEKNLEILEKNPNIICSVSKMKLFGETTDNLKSELGDSGLTKFFKKIKTDFGYMDTYPASGPYEKRVKEYIKNLRHNQIFYGVYRTNMIKKFHVQDNFLFADACTILNSLKFGELFVVDEVLMNVYDGGVSRKGMLGTAKHLHYGLITTLFPMYPFTKWCRKNLGVVNIIKNLDFFIKINLIGEMSLMIDIIRKIKNYGSK